MSIKTYIESQVEKRKDLKAIEDRIKAKEIIERERETALKESEKMRHEESRKLSLSPEEQKYYDMYRKRQEEKAEKRRQFLTNIKNTSWNIGKSIYSMAQSTAGSSRKRRKKRAY